MNVEMTTLDRVDSLAERAYRALREQIATGGLAPGERVTERGLGLQLGVSATPIREALRRLEQERLVERAAARPSSDVPAASSTSGSGPITRISSPSLSTSGGPANQPAGILLANQAEMSSAIDYKITCRARRAPTLRIRSAWPPRT